MIICFQKRNPTKAAYYRRRADCYLKIQHVQIDDAIADLEQGLQMQMTPKKGAMS